MDAATTAFTAQWSDVQGLRNYVIQTGILRRSPVFLGLMAANYSLFGRSTVVGTALLAAFTYGVQSVVAYFAGLMIMPGGRETLRVLRKAHENKFLAKYFPTEDLEPIVQLFARTAEQLDPAREAMLNYSRSILGSAERLSLTTPDGGVLDGVLLGGSSLRAMAAVQPRSSDQDYAAGCRGCIVYFGGNGEHYEMHHSLVQEWGARRKFSLLLVNYRGVGGSGGSCSRTGGLLDAVTALDFLHKGCGLPLNRIVVIGHSIGGGYGTEACRFFPGVLCINDRSFGSLSAVATSTVLAPLAQGGPLAQAWWAPWVRAFFVFVFRHVACWELDSALHWPLLPRGSKVCVSSGEDRVIPPHTQLWAVLQERGVQGMDGVGTLMDMDRRGPGADAHNVDWTRAECDRLDALITHFLRGHPLGDRV